jgi:hypothetical protein
VAKRIRKTYQFRPRQIVFSDGQEDKNIISLIDFYFKHLLLVIHQIGFWTGQKYRNLICGDFENPVTSPYQQVTKLFFFFRRVRKLYRREKRTLK